MPPRPLKTLQCANHHCLSHLPLHAIQATTDFEGSAEPSSGQPLRHPRRTLDLALCDRIPKLLIRNGKATGILALSGRTKPLDGEKRLMNCIHGKDEHGHSQSLTVLPCEGQAC